jgi:cell fate regulator YaaT (PSP1 superfamily)
MMEMPAYMKPFNVVEVRFKGTRKEFYKNVYNLDITNGELVVVELENGYDIGKVSLKGELVKLQMRKAGVAEDADSIKKIIRKANEADIARHKENKEQEVPTMYRARSIAMELNLSMKLSDVEYQGDKRKATFYYTAEDRVDFRELIKRLADAFKVRIEMRQIGYRQEAARLGAIGSCGRELCCSTWLTDLKQVQTSAARYQNLSINQLKLSGQCGKLKCCLNFELESYVEALKEFPGGDNLKLEFTNGTYKFMKNDILKRKMWFVPLFEIGGDWLELSTEQVKEYMKMNEEGQKPELVKAKKEIKKEVELEFVNDMGEGELDRLDGRTGKKKSKPSNKNRNRNRNNNPKPQGNKKPGPNPSPAANNKK